MSLASTMPPVPPSQSALTILQWMAPSLVRDGLLRNEDWVPEHCERACRLYPNQGLHVAATLIAALHPHAIDYLEQAPVLALAMAGGSAPRVRRERQYIALKVGRLIEAGPKLRDLMAAFSLPLPMRKIVSYSVRPGLWKAIQQLARWVEPSTLSQIIPSVAGEQARWLERLGWWSTHLSHRHMLRQPFFEWAAIALSSHSELGIGPSTIDEVGDYFAANPDRFNPKWDWDKATNESDLWHDQIEQMTLTAKHGAAIDQEVNYAPFPIDVEVEGYRFIALRSGRALITEGRKMHHCVASYIGDVMKGLSRIYSIQQDGKRVATAQFVGANCVQLKGPCNRGVGDAVRKAVVEFATIAGASA